MVLRVVSPDQLAERDRLADEAAKADRLSENPTAYQGLAGYVRQRLDEMRRHRETSGINKRLLHALRVYNGEYEPEQLQAVTAFGGSTVYARLTATKCRGATALLRDVYLGPERPWEVEPTPVPTLPENIVESIDQLVQVELATLAQAGQQITPDMAEQRKRQLIDAADQAARKEAREEAKQAAAQLDDLLTEGGFYQAFAEFLTDLPIFPYAVMAGPVVRQTTRLRWINGQAVVTTTPAMYWERVSPFDFYWTPGASRSTDGDIGERKRLTRADLTVLKDVPGYNTENIEAVINEYADGFRDWFENGETERAVEEGRESPAWNQSGMIDTLKFFGSVQGRLLKEFGLTSADGVEDDDAEYMTSVFMCGPYVLKAQISPNPRKRAPYYVTSFQMVPGSVAGHSVVDLISDIQDVANATFRALVNNMGISSGPQVVINTDMIDPSENPDSLYPWKRWRVQSDPVGKQTKPVDFFQPASNAEQLMGIYEKMTQIADEISAIPRYMMGGERVGGAGRTASGLAMMLSNASKVLQQVASNVDRDILTPLLEQLYDYIMLTDQTGKFRGDESIRVRGVTVAAQKETQRARQLEFLQLTGNPVDLQIVGLEGRAAILASVANEIGLDGDKIVKTPDEIRAQMMAAEQAQEQAMLASGGAPGQQAPAPGGEQVKQDAPRTNMVGGGSPAQ